MKSDLSVLNYVRSNIRWGGECFEFSSCIPIFQCSITFVAITGGVWNFLSNLAVYRIFQCSTTFEAISGGVGHSCIPYLSFVAITGGVGNDL